MIKWIKKVLRIIRDYDKTVLELNSRDAQISSRITQLDTILRDRTDIGVDVAYSKRDMGTIITIGRYRGVDYIQTYQIAPDSFEGLITQLKDMSRWGKVRMVDALPHISGVIKRDLW